MKNRILVQMIIALGLTIAIQSCSGGSPTGKTGFVNVGKLMAEFKARKELIASLETKFQRERLWIDSVGLVVQNLESKMKDGQEVAGKLLQQYQKERSLYEEVATKVRASYDEQMQKGMEGVTAQINSYLMDFGKAGGYDYIYGAGGAGELLYAKESLDLTEEAIKYVNERYEGKGK